MQMLAIVHLLLLPKVVGKKMKSVHKICWPLTLNLVISHLLLQENVCFFNSVTYWMELPVNNLGWNYARKLQIWPHFIDLWPYRLTFYPWCVLTLLFCLFLIFSPNLIATGHFWQKLWAKMIFLEIDLWPHLLYWPKLSFICLFLSSNSKSIWYWPF